MQTLFKKRNIINSFLMLCILLLTINLFFVFYNQSVVIKNNALQKETEEIKQRTAAILTDIVHGADLSVRGYAITKNEKLAEPLKKVLENKDSIFSALKILLSNQQYDLAKFTEMKQSVEGYLEFTDYMIDLARKDSTKLLVKLLNEDKGYGVWKKYEAFYVPLFKYEDTLNDQATSNFKMALTRNGIIQLMLFLLTTPLAIYLMYKLRADDKKRAGIVRGMVENNRIYVFNPGTSIDNETQEDFATEFIGNFQKANGFITSISNGNYAVEWEGLNEANQKLNKETLAGKVVSMRDQLILIEQEEGKRKWVNEGLTKFSELVRNHQKSVQDLSLECIRFLSKYLHVQQGSIFVLNEEESEPYLKLTACFAFDKKKYVEKRIALGAGLVGQAFLEGETVSMTHVPQGYLHITSGLGEAHPTCLIIVPMKYNEKMEAVIELASFKKLEEHQVKFLERCGEFIASALQSVKNYEITNRLLQDSHQQSEELKSQEEEMRQSMEEMQAIQEELLRKQKENSDIVERFDLITAVTTEGLWEVVIPENMELNNDTRFKSAHFKKLLGFTDEKDFPDVLGSWINRLHPDHKESSTAAFGAHLMDFSGQTPYDLEYQLKLKSGEYRWFRGIGKTSRDVNGKPLRVAGTVIDIQVFKDMQLLQSELENKVKDKTEELREVLEGTQRKNEELKAAEEELLQNMEELQTTQEELLRKQKENEDILERFNLITAVTTEGLWEVVIPENMELNDDTRFKSAHFKKLLGFKDENDFPDVLGSWINRLHPDHKEFAAAAFGAHLMDFSGQTPYDIEYQLKLKNGEYRWFRAIGKTSRDVNGKPLRVAGTVIDIQVLKDMHLLQIELKKQFKDKT